MKVELVWCEEEGWAESVEDKRRSESEVRELEQKKKKGLRSFMSEHIAQRLPTSDSSVPLPPSDSEPKLNKQKQKQKQKLPAAERDEKYVVSVCVWYDFPLDLDPSFWSGESAC